jgi:hypothetical protein
MNAAQRPRPSWTWKANDLSSAIPFVVCMWIIDTLMHLLLSPPSPECQLPKLDVAGLPYQTRRCNTSSSLPVRVMATYNSPFPWTAMNLLSDPRTVRAYNPFR